MSSELPPNDNRARTDATTPIARTDDQVHGAVPVESQGTLRQEVGEKEREEFGGMKFGSAFFGWVAATGIAVLLTALLVGAGAAVGLGTNTSANQAAGAAKNNAGTVGVVGVIVLLVILLVAYFCGGYVAGRMARFSGAKQGIAVWIWAIAIAIVVAIIGAIAGGQYNILANVNAFPRIPIDEGTLTTAGVITAIGAVVISFVGAVLGGAAGMRFHRRVDRVGLGR
jgi:hypothetical protein